MLNDRQNAEYTQPARELLDELDVLLVAVRLETAAYGETERAKILRARIEEIEPVIEFLLDEEFWLFKR